MSSTFDDFLYIPPFSLFIVLLRFNLLLHHEETPLRYYFFFCFSYVLMFSCPSAFAKQEKIWVGLKECAKKTGERKPGHWDGVFFLVTLEAFHFLAFVGWAKRMGGLVKTGIYFLFALLVSFFFRRTLYCMCVIL